MPWGWTMETMTDSDGKKSYRCADCKTVFWGCPPMFHECKELKERQEMEQGLEKAYKEVQKLRGDRR